MLVGNETVDEATVVSAIRLAICQCCIKSTVFPWFQLRKMDLQGIVRTFVRAPFNVLEWQMIPRQAVHDSAENFHVLYFQQVVNPSLSRTHLPPAGYTVEFAQKMASLVYHYYSLIGC